MVFTSPVSDEDDYDESDEWNDDSDIGCADCPDDECHGHCMSCAYRPVQFFYYSKKINYNIIVYNSKVKKQKSSS